MEAVHVDLSCRDIPEGASVVFRYYGPTGFVESSGRDPCPKAGQIDVLQLGPSDFQVLVEDVANEENGDLVRDEGALYKEVQAYTLKRIVEAYEEASLTPEEMAALEIPNRYKAWQAMSRGHFPDRAFALSEEADEQEEESVGFMSYEKDVASEDEERGLDQTLEELHELF